MSLHYLVKHEMLIARMLPVSCYRKKLQNISHLVASKFARWQEKVYKRCITAVELPVTLLMNVFCSDDIAQL